MAGHPFVTLSLALLTPTLAWGQTGAAPAASEPVTLQDLKTPASPAFQLLGIAPTDVERPTTPRAFAVSLLSALQQGNNVLPNGFAMEVAPYWLVPHDRLEFSTYLDPGIAQSIRQTFTVSLAGSKITSGTDAAQNGLDVGVGFRVSPVPGNSTADVQDLQAAIRLSLTQASVVDALLDQVGIPKRTMPEDLAKTIAQLRSASHPGLKDEQVDAMFDAITDAITEALAASTDAAVVRNALLQLQSDGDAERKQAALDLQQANQTRSGFTVDVAGAVVTRTTSEPGATARVIREGLWVTSGYSAERVSLLGLVRFVGNSDVPGARSNLLDAGIRAIGTAGALNVSFEAIHRIDRSSVRVFDSTSKAVVNLEYKVSEDVSVTSTFGKDFGDTRLGLKGSTITLLGVSFGLGPRPALPVSAQ
jgi:hypothetical protein